MRGGGQTSFVKFGIIMMISLLITNIIMMAVLHQHANDTTIILKEFRKINDVNSGTGVANHRDRHESRDGVANNDVKVGAEIGKSKPDLERYKDKRNGKLPKDVHKDVRKPDEAGKSKTIQEIMLGNNKAYDDTVSSKFNKNFKHKEQVLDTKDVDAMIKRLNSSKLESIFPKSFWMQDLQHFVSIAGKRKRTSGSGLPSVKRTYKTTSPSWKKFHQHIQHYALYDSHDPVIDDLLKDLTRLRIKSTDDTESGTELKVIVTLEDGGRAVMKPMRYPRDWPINLNTFVFDDMERHYAEIAAFHLDRLLGFNRVPPTIGRKINMTEFYKVAPKTVKDTYFTSPVGNTCFYGKCDYFCDSAFPFCGSPDIIEVSMMAYLPSRNIADRMSWYQPYKGTYSKWKKPLWEKDERFCDTLKKKYPYNTGKLLLDMIDAHTFDFLNGNIDRHSFAFFKEFGNFSFPILYDNGRGYGSSSHDPVHILTPLRQCCIIRKSTFLKYVKLYSGPDRLSGFMERSLSTDPVSPVLLDKHLEALDRRLVKILQTVAGCLEKHSVNEVVIYDGY